MKHPTPSRATDALIGEKKQNGKQKRTKERNRERFPNPAAMDHSVASYDAQGSFCEPGWVKRLGSPYDHCAS